MAITASIESIEFAKDNDAQAHVIAVVVSDTQKIRCDVTASSVADLKLQLRAALGNLQSASDLKALNPGAQLDLSLPGSSPEDVANAAFLAAFAIVQSAKRKVDAGIVAADDKDVAQALDTAKAAYSASMVGLG